MCIYRRGVAHKNCAYKLQNALAWSSQGYAGHACSRLAIEGAALHDMAAVPAAFAAALQVRHACMLHACQVMQQADARHRHDRLTLPCMRSGAFMCHVHEVIQSRCGIACGGSTWPIAGMDCTTLVIHVSLACTSRSGRRTEHKVPQRWRRSRACLRIFWRHRSSLAAQSFGSASDHRCHSSAALYDIRRLFMQQNLVSKL